MGSPIWKQRRGKQQPMTQAEGLARAWFGPCHCEGCDPEPDESEPMAERGKQAKRQRAEVRT